MVFYWSVHHMEGDNGQDIGHTLIPDFSLLFRLSSLLAVLVRFCVLVEGETLLHRACKRNHVETVLQILARPGTDVNVKGNTLLLFPVSAVSPSSDFPPTVSSGVFEERLTLEGGKG